MTTSAERRTALLACAGVFALALPILAAPSLALAQRTISLGGSAPDAPFPLDASVGPKVPAVDPATVQGLPSAHDYHPPEGIRFSTTVFVSENVPLTAQWFWTAENEGKKLPTVIMAPGWGATAATLREGAVDLARAGYQVMLFDYRGWGDSDGRVMLTGAHPVAVGPATGGTFSAEVRELRGYVDPAEQAQDWLNAVSYAVTVPTVDADRVGVLGSDLAGGHVIYAAAFEPRIKALVSQVSRMDTRPSKPYQADPARIIAEADAAASRLATGQAQYPTDPGRAVGAKVARWTPIDQAEDVTAPALFVLAQKEELFSNTHNGQLACEEVKGPRKMVMLPEATHYDIYVWQRTRAINAAIDWFDRYLKPPGAPTRVPLNPKQPARGDCNPPPPPPSGDSDKNGSGEGHKSPPTSGRFN